jgi:hypothetical protein
LGDLFAASVALFANQSLTKLDLRVVNALCVLECVWQALKRDTALNEALLRTCS